MRPCHGRDRGFESRRLRQITCTSVHLHLCGEDGRHVVLADVAQSVEHVLGKDEVMGSIPVISSMD
jgi:urease gamma subunit